MDNERFSEFVDNMQAQVYRVAYSYVRNFADAEEITQDAFLKLYCSERSFKTDDEARAYLIRIAVNLSINLLRSGWRRNRAELDDKLIPAPDEKSRDLDELIKRLTPEQMTAVYLHYYEGYPIKEIAKMCGTTSASVAMRLARARARLKTMLTKEDYQ